MSIENTIREQLATHPVILYMKGVPEMPQCGFSAKAVAALQATGIPFAYVNVLQAPSIREKLPGISEWPTFPQLFVNGELIGGSDIVAEIAQKGELKPMLEKAVAGKEAG
ncbi:Grx4 family monothiol glutaredoxin [Methylocaldum sp.]|uniref:Grx4 family monothiol glutaredoxin n=1 Tax=Methylocaldum sp. TaxID=1969727 RepID=UPI002D638F12|nr:Grx4 family monothiol glutaredoxin [Methylocaldum sp.]HYE37499.1 Grx4 family monothiol glutaredoxin [Methylocaldum sp.]